MGRRSLLPSRCVSHHQGQLAATRQMVPTWMVPPPPTASLRWLDRGWLGAPAIRRLGRRQVVGSNWQRLTKSLAKPTNRGVVVSAQASARLLKPAPALPIVCSTFTVIAALHFSARLTHSVTH